jgi:EAL domain-containing protein (putative c-di-GMP-specific phosphodiesterase class I)
MNDLENRYLRKLKVTQRLQHAISHNGFKLLFQPQFDLNKKIIHSAEALIRWYDDDLGPVYPDEFIPLAENSGDITLITDWVFSEALIQLERWHAAGFELGVSINLSAKDILKDDFIDRVILQIDARKISPHLLMLEVTESALVEDMDHAIANLRRLYEAGVHLAMDDFGTGFSSLAQLKVLPVHELKIDKSFVLNLDKDIDDQKIVRSTIEMAHNLGLTTIAEGVENSPSIEMLKSMNCDAIQGYFLSKPITSDDLISWLETFNSQQPVLT